MIIYCRPRVTPTSSLPSQTEVSSAVCSLNNSEFSLLSDQLREQLASVWSARGSVSTSIARSVERCIRLDCPALSRNHPFYSSSLLLLSSHPHPLSLPQGCSSFNQLQELRDLLSLEQGLAVFQLGNSSLSLNPSSSSSEMGWEEFFCGEEGGDVRELRSTLPQVILGNSYQEGVNITSTVSLPHCYMHLVSVSN